MRFRALPGTAVTTTSPYAATQADVSVPSNPSRAAAR